MEFHVGQRVKATASYCNNCRIINKVGTIVYVSDDEDRCGICFDEYISGHSCDGRCNHGHGWFIPCTLLVPVDFSPLGLEELV